MIEKTETDIQSFVRGMETSVRCWMIALNAVMLGMRAENDKRARESCAAAYGDAALNKIAIVLNKFALLMLPAEFLPYDQRLELLTEARELIVEILGPYFDSKIMKENG